MTAFIFADDNSKNEAFASLFFRLFIAVCLVKSRESTLRLHRGETAAWAGSALSGLCTILFVQVRASTASLGLRSRACCCYN